MRVLIVHDTQAMRMIVQRALREVDEIDYIAPAADARAAIEVLQHDEIDFVLSDWNLGAGEMSGIELLEALRVAGWEVPVGFITAETSPQVRRRALDSGAEFIVNKPFTPTELGAAIRGVDLALLTAADAVADESVDEEEWTRERAIEDLLSRLGETKVGVRLATVAPDLHSSRYLARYHDDADKLAAVCIFETCVAAALAAALTRWSPRLAESWASTGTLPELLIENLYEVANVLSQFVREDGRRVILNRVEGYAPGEQFPEAASIVGTAAEHFEVDVEGHRPGLVTIAAIG